MTFILIDDGPRAAWDFSESMFYGHPNDDFIICMILIDMPKEICALPNSCHNGHSSSVHYLELIDQWRHCFSISSSLAQT